MMQKLKASKAISTVTHYFVPPCQRRANCSTLRANVPKGVPIFQFRLPKGIPVFQLFFKRIFQLCLTFANFKNIWAILDNLSREIKNLNFVICVISSTKNLVNLKPLASISMEHVGLTEQLFGQWKMDLNIFFHLPNFILRV